MEYVSTVLTVLFEEPFWVGVMERQSDSGYVRLSEKADSGQNRQAATAYVHLSTPHGPSLASFTRSKPFRSA